jgi:hypothetical protein
MAAEDNIRWIGWCHEVGKGSPDKPEHDKIWGYMVKDGKATVFWGRRTANLTFKIMSPYEADELADKKKNKGYRTVTFDRLKELDWDFEDRFHEKLCLTMLGNFYHRAGEKYAQ